MPQWNEGFHSLQQIIAKYVNFKEIFFFFFFLINVLKRVTDSVK